MPSRVLPMQLDSFLEIAGAEFGVPKTAPLESLVLGTSITNDVVAIMSKPLGLPLKMPRLGLGTFQVGGFPSNVKLIRLAWFFAHCQTCRPLVIPLTHKLHRYSVSQFSVSFMPYADVDHSGMKIPVVYCILCSRTKEQKNKSIL